MEQDLKKVFFIIVAIAAIGALTIAIATPTINKINEQKGAIEGVSFTAPKPS